MAPDEPDASAARRRLEVAVGLAVLEVFAQAVVLIGRGALGGAPLRVVFLATKLPFAAMAWRRKPGGYLGLWAYELAGLAAVLDLPGSRPVRGGFGLVAIIVMVLLGRASSAFPPVEWKAR